MSPEQPASSTVDPAATRSVAEVAVPIPLRQPLSYLVPPALAGLARPGARVRVPVGKRKLTGVILDLSDEPPLGLELKPLEAVVDLEPVLAPELLELGRFVADYYLAPVGEVFRSMLPPHLEPWGDRRVWLTAQGALGRPRDEGEAAVIEALRDAGRLSLAELQSRLGAAVVQRAVASLVERGWLALGTTGGRGTRRGSRYLTAVELIPGSLEDLLSRVGRSAPGKEVVRFLAELGRPATASEVLAAVDCSAGVLRRLHRLGILRRFSQIENLGLGQHQTMRAAEADLVLRPDQESAAAALVGAVEAGRPASFLLGGVTGSGKTEVYLRAVSAALAAGRSAILLVPEIALVPALAATLRSRFGAKLAILHSALSGPERSQEWERIRRGEAQVVLGPRSAVFAPVRELGLLVVDEEQDAAFKQDKSPRYHGRDLALLRARRQGAVAVLTSATPSLETRHNVEIGKIDRLELTQRVGQGQLPDGVLVDLRQIDGVRRPGEIVFSALLKEELAATLDRGEQAILLRNRRGYSPVLLCRACGEDLRCEDCGLPRTFHKRFGWVLCHYCGSKLPAPERCVACGETALEPIGSGTERVEETFQQLFPGVPVDTLDRDSIRRRGSLASVLDRFERGETRVLVGTQMVSKGHHFPRVSLAAVLNADTYLAFPDFRAVERTYGLVTQLAGRAGRGARPGKVIIQSFHPDHYAIRAALRHDDDAFVREEMRFRRIFHYPPFTRMILLLVRHANRERARSAIEELGKALERHSLAAGTRISGPAPAPFEKLRGKWRFQLLVRGESGRRLRALVAEVLPQQPKADLVVDVDPLELL